MAKNIVQFHGTPTEIVQFLEKYVLEYNLYIVGIRLNPIFKAEVISELQHLSDVENICLSIQKPDTEGKSYTEFLNKNPNCIVIAIGKFESNTLEESIISTGSTNPDILKIWKSVVKKLKAITLAGAWVVNPNTNLKSYYKQHLYTTAAKEMYESGVKIAPVVGWNFYLLDKSEL